MLDLRRMHVKCPSGLNWRTDVDVLETPPEAGSDVAVERDPLGHSVRRRR